MRQIIRLAAAMVVAVLFGGAAVAADLSTLPVKAAPVVASSIINAPCSIAGCSGFYLGAEISGSGSGVNVLNLASLNANGTGMGINGGYQFFNGTYWLGAKVSADYDVGQQNPSVGGQTLTSSNKFFAFEGVEVGGNLAQLFGLTPINLPGPLANAVPTVLVGACQHGSLTGYCAGAAAHFFIPNSRFTVDVQYLNAQYGQTQTGTVVGVPVTQSTENRGTFGFSYHF